MNRIVSQGFGVPTHTAPYASIYIDRGDEAIYIQTQLDTGNTWVELAHNLISGITDTVDRWVDPYSPGTTEPTIIAGTRGANTVKFNPKTQSSYGVAGGRLSLNGTRSTMLDEVTAPANAISYYPYSSTEILLCTKATDPREYRVCEIIASNGTRPVIAAPGLAPDLPHDLFLYWDGTAVLMEAVAWASTTARVTALQHDNFIGLVQGGANNTRRYVGTAVTMTFNEVTQWRGDSVRSRTVSNAYNVIPRPMYYGPAFADHTYNSSTIRQYRGAIGYRLTAMLGVYGTNYIELEYSSRVSGTGSATGTIGIGVDTTTAYTVGGKQGVAKADGDLEAKLNWGHLPTDIGYRLFNLNQSTIVGNITYQDQTTSPIMVQHTTMIATFYG